MFYYVCFNNLINESNIQNKNDIFCAGVQHPHETLSYIITSSFFFFFKEVVAGAVSFAKEFQTLFIILTRIEAIESGWRSAQQYSSKITFMLVVISSKLKVDKIFQRSALGPFQDSKTST